MKLRNKKTGETVNAMFYAPIGCYELNIWKRLHKVNYNAPIPRINVDYLLTLKMKDVYHDKIINKISS